MRSRLRSAPGNSSAGRSDQSVNLPERDVLIDAVERDDIGDEVSDPTNPDRLG